MGVITTADEAKDRAIKHLKDAAASLKEAHKELLVASDEDTWNEYSSAFRDTLLNKSIDAIAARASVAKIINDIE